MKANEMIYVVIDFRTSEMVYKTNSDEDAERFASQSPYYEVEDDQELNRFFYGE